MGTVFGPVGGTLAPYNIGGVIQEELCLQLGCVVVNSTSP